MFFPPARNGSVLWGLCRSEAEAPFSVLGGRNVSKVLLELCGWAQPISLGGHDGLGGTGDGTKWGGFSPCARVFGGVGCRWKPQQINGAGYELSMGRAPGLPMCPGHSWTAEVVLASRGTCGGCCPRRRWLFCMWDWAFPVAQSGLRMELEIWIHRLSGWLLGQWPFMFFVLRFVFAAASMAGPGASPLQDLCRS